MQRVAHAGVMATWGGTGAHSFVVHRCSRMPLGFIQYPRRCRSHKSIASAWFTASIACIASGKLTAWAASLRSTLGAACGHRRLTTRSSGPRSAAAYFGR